MKVLLLVLLIACGDKQPSESSPPSPAPVAPKPSGACDTLDRPSCLTSDKCTLVVSGTKSPSYLCRPEQGACELGHLQNDQAGCAKRPGCTFVPGQCYCACKGAGRTKVEDASGHSCKCFCGGGPPPMCVPSAPPAPCEQLDRQACLTSSACTLVHVKDSQYACRPEQGECERNHVQPDGADCTRRAGCKFEPASCYCPCRGYGKTAVEDGPTAKPCKCECAFGAPPACVPS